MSEWNEVRDSIVKCVREEREEDEQVAVRWLQDNLLIRSRKD